jgi:hypothetical protein
VEQEGADRGIGFVMDKAKKNFFLTKNVLKLFLGRICAGAIWKKNAYFTDIYRIYIVG